MAEKTSSAVQGCRPFTDVQCDVDNVGSGHTDIGAGEAKSEVADAGVVTNDPQPMGFGPGHFYEVQPGGLRQIAGRGDVVGGTRPQTSVRRAKVSVSALRR